MTSARCTQQVGVRPCGRSAQVQVLRLSLAEEQAKVQMREEMLHTLQEELASLRQRTRAAEAKACSSYAAVSRAESARRDAEEERVTLEGKVTLAMMEASARARQLAQSDSQACNRNLD